MCLRNYPSILSLNKFFEKHGTFIDHNKRLKIINRSWNIHRTR